MLRRRLMMAAQGVWTTVTATTPFSVQNALKSKMQSLIQYGKMVQNGTPTPDAPVWPSINNGTVRMVRPSGLPVRYQMVEWLTVTSPSKRITITGFKTKSTQEFECKWYRSAQINCYLYASDASSSLTTNTTAYLATTNGTWRFDGRAAGFSAPVETICTSIQNKDGVWINGSKVGSYGDAGDFVSTNDLYLLNGSGSADVRLYYLKVSESGNLVLDLVPVRDNVSGTYGVYDKVNGAYYTNAEATFEVGADVEDAPYVTIDGTPEVLTVGGFSALTDADIVDGYSLNSNTGARQTNSNRCYTSLGFFPKGKTVIVRAKFTSIGGYLLQYREDSPTTYNHLGSVAMGAIEDIGGGWYQRSATSTEDAWLYVQCTANMATSLAAEWSVLRTAQTAAVPDLYAVGDYKDEVDIISGVVTRNVGMKVVDGTENFNTTNGTFYCGVDRKMENTMVVCSHFDGDVAPSTGTANLPDLSVKGHPSNARIYFRYNAITTVADFKAFLAAQYAAGTPVIVWYPLATPVTESITPQELSTVKGANVIDATSDIAPFDVSVTYRARK